MPAKVRLKDVTIDNVTYPVPSNVTWHEGGKAWVVSITKDGKQQQKYFSPKQSENSMIDSLVRAAAYASRYRILPIEEVGAAKRLHHQFHRLIDKLRQSLQEAKTRTLVARGETFEAPKGVYWDAAKDCWVGKLSYKGTTQWWFFPIHEYENDLKLAFETACWWVEQRQADHQVLPNREVSYERHGERLIHGIYWVRTQLVSGEYHQILVRHPKTTTHDCYEIGYKGEYSSQWEEEIFAVAIERRRKLYNAREAMRMQAYRLMKKTVIRYQHEAVESMEAQP